MGMPDHKLTSSEKEVYDVQAMLLNMRFIERTHAFMEIGATPMEITNSRWLDADTLEPLSHMERQDRRNRWDKLP